MRFFKWCLIVLFFVPLLVEAQFVYTFKNDIPVKEEGELLNQAFSGGFIAPQFSAIDLNLDGTNDLFVFDRASNKAFTFLFKDGTYTYAPFYESFFPKDLKNWVLLRDYNCDGKMDLFTSSIFGMRLYENTSNEGLSWSLKYPTVFTEGSSGQINLQVSNSDLPAIVDVDNDGDLDILNFNFATGEEIEFHRNNSVENTGSCGMELVRVTRRYGDFKECNCDVYAFGVGECPTGGRIEHTGSKAILSFNYASQTIQDLLIGQEFCYLTGYLPNSGTITDAKMESVSFNFPNSSNPIQLNFPAFYELDLFNDGVVDLLVASNKYEIGGLTEESKTVYFYTKNLEGDYAFVSNNFLKEDMIDVGHKASPAFVDLDFDGDEDMLLGTGIIDGGASIWMYENTGTATSPSFELRTKDYLALKSGEIQTLKLQVFDVNKDKIEDLIIYKIKNNQLIAMAYLNTGNPVNPFTAANLTGLSMPQLSMWDNPTYVKLGAQTGLLIGKQAGNLEYYRTSNILSPSWVLISDEYLDIAVDFNKRNLHVVIDDFNANGNEDLLTLDDAGALVVYENFLSESMATLVLGMEESNEDFFDFNFGRITQMSTSNIFGTTEPTISVGLLTGGVQLLQNTQRTGVELTLELKIITYPNPVESKQLLVQSNKNGVVRVIDATGKVVIDGAVVSAGVQVSIPLQLQAALYLVEVTSTDGQKKVNRIVVIN